MKIGIEDAVPIRHVTALCRYEAAVMSPLRRRGVTPLHSGSLQHQKPAVACDVDHRPYGHTKNVSGEPAPNAGATLTGTAIMAPSRSPENGSFPSYDQMGSTPLSPGGLTAHPTPARNRRAARDAVSRPRRQPQL